MKTISTKFFTVTNKVHIISYNGETFKPGDKIEVAEDDLKGFDAKWIIPIDEVLNPDPKETIEKFKEGNPEENTKDKEADALEEEVPKVEASEEEKLAEDTKSEEVNEPTTQNEETVEEVTTSKRGRKPKSE